MDLSDFEDDFGDGFDDDFGDEFDDNGLDYGELDDIENILPQILKEKPEPDNIIEEQQTEHKEEKKIKKKKKQTKWNKVAQLLKEKGLLKKNVNNFIDHVTFELHLSAGKAGIVVKELSCGFFDWTFSFFFNNESHRENFFDSAQSAFKKMTRLKGRKFLKNLRRSLLKKRRKKAKRRNIAGGFITGNARKIVQWKKKKAFILFAECHPNSICSTDIHGHNIYEWEVVSSFKTVWKGSKRDTESIIEKKRPCVFMSVLPAVPIRCYGPKRLKKHNILIVHMWVNKIKALSLIPPLIFEKELPNKQSVCLKCDNEYFHVNKSKLAMYSSVFHKNILNEGLGDDLKNPIKIDDKFKQSLRLALKIIFVHKTRIPCANVIKLLDFAHEYKISAILSIIEDSLINSRKCIHFNFQQKIDLAYKYELDELKNNFCKLNNSVELIEKNLSNEALHSEFKDQLRRKLACMKAAEAAGIARINEKKEEKAKKRRSNKLNKKAKKAALAAERSLN